MYPLFRLLAVTALSLIGTISGSAMAQDYPSKTIRIIVPFAAGGLTDVLGRLAGDVLSKRLGVPVVVENRVGANGAIGSSLAAKANPDGYTLLQGGAGYLVINPSLYRNYPFDPINDLSPIIQTANAMNVLVVHPSVPATNVQEFVKYLKANPGKLSYASGGIGSIHHMAAELFYVAAGVKMLHVPYQGGSAPAYSDLFTGRVQVMFDTLPNILQHVKSGKVRALAVTGAQRSSELPNVPTVAEQGYPDYEASGWWGLLAPAGTPVEIIRKLNSELRIGMAELAPKLRELGAVPVESSPEEFSALIKKETQKWARIVKLTGATLD